MNKDWLINQLPAVMAKDPFLNRFTGIFQEIATGLRVEANAVPDYIDVGIAPHDFVRWIGSWTGLPVQIDFGDEATARKRVREMVASSALLYRRRGTSDGLAGLISVVTGEEAMVSDTGGIFRAGDKPPSERRITVEIQSTGGLDAPLLVSLIKDELPVNCTFELVVAGVPVQHDESSVGLSRDPKA